MYNKANRSFYQAMYSMNSRTERSNLGKYSIVMDTRLLVSIFRDKELINNITCTRRVFKLIMNSGSVRSKKIESYHIIKVSMNIFNY